MGYNRMIEWLFEMWKERRVGLDSFLPFHSLLSILFTGRWRGTSARRKVSSHGLWNRAFVPLFLEARPAWGTVGSVLVGFPLSGLGTNLGLAKGASLFSRVVFEFEVWI